MRTRIVLAVIGSTLLLPLALAGCEDGRHGYGSDRNYSYGGGAYPSDSSQGCYDRSGQWHSSCDQGQYSRNDDCYDHNGNRNNDCDRHDHNRDDHQQSSNWLDRLFK